MLSPHQKRTLRKLDCSEWNSAKLPWVSDKTVTTLVTLGFLEEKQDESHTRMGRIRRGRAKTARHVTAGFGGALGSGLSCRFDHEM